MKRRAVALLLIALLLGPAEAAVARAQQATPRSPQIVEVASFTGHRCRIATCRFFTSSYSTAIYYYDRRTSECSQTASCTRPADGRDTDQKKSPSPSGLLSL